MNVPPPPPFHRELTTVGVTGTNGKSTTTTWIAAALRHLSRPVARATTLGFFADDEELSLAQTYDDFLEGMRLVHARGGRHAAIELTSEALARGFARAWPCRVGVFTNLTHDHLEAHGSAEHYLASKAQLFVTLGEGASAVLNASDPVYELLREVTPPHVSMTTYAVPSRGASQGEPDLVAEHVRVSWDGTTILCRARDERRGLPTSLTVRAIGEVYAENALAALLGAVAAGVAPAAAAAAIGEAPPPPGRFEVIHRRPWVVVDYAHSPDALARTVGTARTLADRDRARLLVVFGAGGKRDRGKRGAMGAAARAADAIVLTSDNPRDEDPAAIARAVAAGLEGHGGVEMELDRRRAITRAIEAAGPNDVVLVAGKGHETEQIVGETRAHFSDAEVARDALRAR
ncbi:MAG: UDP-N-acetylmuramyl-tripeptide synthetase [Deltaproteobacteria bacterium]|nr:UDP-N-acetylmuramyl-tripeptide synthetase [Deltaproteobacteria bacterium]